MRQHNHSRFPNDRQPEEPFEAESSDCSRQSDVVRQVVYTNVGGKLYWRFVCLKEMEKVMQEMLGSTSTNKELTTC